jgi:hypothetical protein
MVEESVSNEHCREHGPDGVLMCSLVLDHKEDHTAKSFMDGFVYATWPREKVVPKVMVDYDPKDLSCTERYWVDQLEFLVDAITKDLDQEGACKILYHYDLQRKRLDIIQATPPSRRTT